MKVAMAGLMAIALFLAGHLPALGQEQDTAFNEDHRGRFERYLRSDEMVAARQAYAVQLQNQRNKGCDEAPELSRDYRGMRAYEFDDDNRVLSFPDGADRPQEAVWIEYYEVLMCYIRDPAWARVTISNGAPPQFEWAPPGPTKLSPAELQQHWPGMLAATISLHHLYCRAAGLTPQHGIISIRQAGGPDIWLGLATRNAWDEQWTIRVCGEDAPMEFRFRRDPETREIESVGHAVEVLVQGYRTVPGTEHAPQGARDPEASERRRERARDRMCERDPYCRDRNDD